jgi:flagellin-like hook-associated protein FlgL
MAHSQYFSQEYTTLKASEKNLQNAQSFSSVQDGYLEQIQSALHRMGELAILATDVITHSKEPTPAGKRYELVNGSFTWDEAKADAETKGGQLATIKSADEKDAIKQVIGAQKVWIGGTDEASEGQWKWVDGSDVVYQNWNTMPIEPNGGTGENHLEMYTNGTWNDGSKNGRFPYIMEFTLPSTAGSDYESEFAQLAALIDSMATKTFNGIALFDGSTHDVKVGLNNQSVTQSGVDLTDATYTSLLAPGTNGFFVSGVQQALAKLPEIQDALQLASEQRATVGANMARLDHELDTLRASADNIKASLSRIQDVDLASEATELAKNKLLAEVSSNYIHKFEFVPKTLMTLMDSPLSQRSG